MRFITKLIKISLSGILVLAILCSISLAGLYFYITPRLPPIDALQDFRMQIPLRIYTDDGLLIAEFGEKRRTPVEYPNIPEKMIQAILAAEDDRFFEHPGVDYQGILRAAIQLILTGEKRQGGSTITMQVARNFYLSSEKTYTRKINEIFLSFKLEKELTKEEILELYLNKIFLGHRAYGIGAAAQVYYGKPLTELDIAQFATIAGLPKAPSALNPVTNPEASINRRNYVLGRMRQLDFITAEQYEHAMSSPVTASLHISPVEIEAPYVAEMARAEVLKRFHDQAYTDGINVVTTIKSHLQVAANTAVKNALHEYDQRHGYRGPLTNINIEQPGNQEHWKELLASYHKYNNLLPAMVLAVEDDKASAYTSDEQYIEIDITGVEWARKYINENRRGPTPKKISDALSRGDIIYVSQITEQEKDAGTKQKISWALSQTPEVEGALVSLNPENGAIYALAGGYDYYRSKFNRAIQGGRQPGSNFKPFIYAAALNNGFHPSSVILDAPVVFEDSGLENTWRPENYSGKLYGPTRLREALVNSRNLVSIRILQSMGIQNALDYLDNFGFNKAATPRNLSLALGSGVVTPLELATAYSIFANTGYRIENFLIRKITNQDDELLYKAEPLIACNGCEDETMDSLAEHNSNLVETETNELVQKEKPHLAPRVISENTAYLITSIMRDVIDRGTGRRAKSLGRTDLAGKTGTTNDQKDAWFSGFTQGIVTTSWVGFDQNQPLGARETGGRAALPMWIDYMKVALRDIPQKTLNRPEGIVTVRIDPETGLQASANNPDAIFEIFDKSNLPDKEQDTANGAGGADITPEDIF